MDILRAAASRLTSLWRNLRHRQSVDADLDDELTAVFETRVDELAGGGMTPAEARRAAALEFGRIDSIKTQVREARIGAGLETAWHDVTFGARLLRRNPLFAFTATLSLALGIGATTTMFSLVNALLLRDVQVAAPRQLVELWRTTQFGRGTAFSYPAYQRLRDENTVFNGVIALAKNPMTGSTAGGSRAGGRFVSGNFFEVLGLTPLAGRLLSQADDRLDAPEGSAVAVLSYRFWVREFGGSAGALGKTLRIDAVPFTIVGVAPAGFDDLAVGKPADFFMPMGSEPLVRRKSLLRSAPVSWIGIVGRLKPGVTSEAARAGLDPIFSRFMSDMAADVPDPEARQRLRAQRLLVESASNGVSDVRRDFSRPVRLLMGAVTLVLFIACANVVNLLLARGVTRRREIAVRLAIGASRARVVRQLLTESALLGMLGAALGLIAAAWGAPLALSLLVQGGAPIDLDVAPDRRVLFFAAAVALGASLVAGVLPAFRTARADITPSFQGNTRSLSLTRESTRWGQGLIAAQVALALVLVAGAALLVATLRNIRGLHPGFDARGVVLLTVDPARAGYTGERLSEYYRSVLNLARALPGVQAASLSKITPVSGGGIDLPIAVEGRRREPGVMVLANRTSEGFFATMAIPMLLGRDFVPQDGARDTAAAVVNDAFVQRYFRNENPIGRRFTLNGPIPLEIVGVVANSKYFTLRDVDRPTVYMFGIDTPDPGGLTLAVRTSGDPLTFARGIQDRVQSVAPAVPVSDLKTLSSQVERSLVTERLVARLLGAFAALSLFLAAVGLHGVLGYQVARRTGEIGLRLALGATRGAVLRSVLRQSAIVVVIGSAAGIPAALLSSRSIASLLYDVTPFDAHVLGLTVATLFTVAMLAAALPAWRASRVDPLIALRYE
jgi:putative ABC transport system permease protein